MRMQYNTTINTFQQLTTLFVFIVHTGSLLFIHQIDKTLPHCTSLEAHLRKLLCSTGMQYNRFYCNNNQHEQLLRLSTVYTNSGFPIFRILQEGKLHAQISC